MTTILPPNMTPGAFDAVCEELRKIVGPEWVFTRDDDIQGYFDPYFPGDPAEMGPCGAVAPNSVAQVQAILVLASNRGLPLWVVSTGKNYVYGGASPVLAGSMVLDLKRMKSIIEVNEELAYAIVEPGVSYFDLHRHLKERGSRLWIDCPTPGWGSVLGNALERGQGYTAYADHIANQCGLEVVLPNGDLIRTGMGGMTGNPSWPLYKHGFGPSVDGLFAQSNLGVVTKMGIWLMPAPEVYGACDLTVPREEDIVALIDALRPLRLNDTIPFATVRNWHRQAAGMTTKAQWHNGDGAMPEAAIDAMLAALKLKRWRMTFPLYGSREIVEAKFKLCQAAFLAIPGAELKIKMYSAGEVVAESHEASAGIPSLNFGILNWMGGAGAHIEAPPIFPLQGQAFWAYYQERARLYRRYGFDHYAGLTTMWARCAFSTGSIIFDRNDADQVARARQCGREAIDLARRHGFAAYRGHIAEMDLIADSFDFNDHAAMRFYERLKDTLDPAGILSPGKQGVWPKAMRANRRVAK